MPVFVLTHHPRKPIEMEGATTFKSRWRRIYERVAAIDPELLPDRQDADGRHGDEKRRRLIEYLRHHLEELRP